MFRGAVFSLLVAIPVTAQFRTKLLDPSGQSSIASGRITTDGDIVIGGSTLAGQLQFLNAYQSKHGSSGLRRTHDGGLTWQQAQRPLPTPFRLVADQGNADTLYALDTSGLYRSADAAETWSKILAEKPLDVRPDTQAPTTVYALTATELLTSPDSGQTWKRRALPAPATANGSAPFLQIALDPYSRGVVYACGLAGLYRTSDDGGVWSKIGFVTPVFTCSAVMLDPAKPGVVYVSGTSAGTLSGIWRSTDNMTSWTQLSGPFGTTFTLDPLHSGVLYAFGRSEGIISNDYGDTWKPLGITRIGSGSIYVIPGEPSTVVYPMGTSYDGGQTWRGQLSFTLASVAGSPAVPGTGYILTAPEQDGFFARLDPAGEIRFCTGLGGNYRDYVTSVATDDLGHTYAAGFTNSTDFPVTPGAAQTEPIPSFSNGFVVKFDPAGNVLWSTLTRAGISSMAVDADYSVVFFTGGLGRISPDGGRIEYLSGEALQDEDSYTFGPYLTHMALATEGEMVVAGELGFPYSNSHARLIAFRVDRNGKLISKTKLDARGALYGLEVDREGNAVLTGDLTSEGLPTTPNAWEEARPGYIPAFVTRFSRSGEIVSSTLLGGSGDLAYSMVLASNGDAIISGHVNTPATYRTVNPVLFPPEVFSADGRKYFLARISADATTARYAFLMPQWRLVALPSDDLAVFSTRDGLVFLNLPAVDP